MTGRPPRLEVTDLVRGWQPDGTRSPVSRSAVLDRLAASGQRRAARIVAALPHDGDVLDADACDAVVLRAHRELQRLAEELVQPRRVAERVAALLPGDGPVRLVDVGCGIGFTLRWLAARAGWGARVELVGVDLDGTLVDEASRLARAEALDVTFVHGDAFAPGVAVDQPDRTVVVSAGLLHHLPADGLEAFFAAQQHLGVRAFSHWDPAPGPWTAVGARVFHRARMREPLSRHDGVLSALRAHPAGVLRDAARAGAPSYDVEVAPDPGWWGSVVEVVRPVTGVHR